MRYQDEFIANEEVIDKKTGRKGVVKEVHGSWVYVWMFTEKKKKMVRGDNLLFGWSDGRVGIGRYWLCSFCDSENMEETGDA